MCAPISELPSNISTLTEINSSFILETGKIITKKPGQTFYWNKVNERNGWMPAAGA